MSYAHEKFFVFLGFAQDISHWISFQVFFSLICLSQLIIGIQRARSSIRFSNSGLSFYSRYVANINFMTDAVKLIEKGYNQSANKAYQLLRSDGNIIVLPPSSVVELSAIPPDIADGTKALEHDLMGKYTGLNFILESRLHHRIVQRKLTPNLGELTPNLEDELNRAVDDMFPSNSDGEWTTVQLYPLLLSLTARTSARAFVGTSFCRDQKWLDVAVNFVEDLFRTVVILRAFPAWMHPVVSHLIPSYWRGKGYFRKARQILEPYIQDRLATMSSGIPFTKKQQEPSALNWLVDIAEGSERNATRIAHTETVLSLAGIHTMLLRQLSVIYDLTAHPKFLDEVREEISSLASTWSKSSYSQLRKLDSVMRESQRMAPPTVLGLKRIMQQPYTLEDGTYLAKGSYVCVAAYAIENDLKVTPEPEKFDGMRSYRQNGATSISNIHAFASTEPNVLGFGLGKTACPGRFFASLVIKMSIVKLMSDFEFQFMPGQSRPKNWVAHEFLFASPWDKIQIRRRAKSTSPF